jgi:type II secretory pathway component PulF
MTFWWIIPYLLTGLLCAAVIQEYVSSGHPEELRTRGVMAFVFTIGWPIALVLAVIVFIVFLFILIVKGNEILVTKLTTVLSKMEVKK